MTARLAYRLWMSRTNGEAVLDACAQMGLPPPPEAVEPPCNFPWWAQVCETCFWDCDTERERGWGIGPIPSSKIRGWCRAEQMRPGLARIVHDVVRRMDAKYLEIEIEAERQKAKE